MSDELKDIERDMNLDMIAIDHGTGNIDLRHLAVQGRVTMMRPIEIHHKADGDVNDEPSFAIVMSDMDRHHVFGEVSLKMLNDTMRKLGYEVKPI